jgi:hypothetical protein
MAIARVNGGAFPVAVTGRSLTMYTVTKTGVQTGSDAVDSDFEKLVRAIQTIASIEILGTPAAGAFRVAISGAAPTAAAMQTLLAAAVSGTTVADFVF